MKTVIKFKPDDLPFVEEIEELVMEMMQEISTWDITVFRNVYDKKIKFKTVDIEVKHNNFYLKKEFILTRPGTVQPKRQASIAQIMASSVADENFAESLYSYTKECTPDIVRRYTLCVTFDEHGNLYSYSIDSSSSNVPLHSVSIGDKQLLINSASWYNRESFSTEAFQYSVSEPKSPFDMVFVNNIILRFGVGV